MTKSIWREKGFLILTKPEAETHRNIDYWLVLSGLLNSSLLPTELQWAGLPVGTTPQIVCLAQLGFSLLACGG